MEIKLKCPGGCMAVEYDPENYRSVQKLKERFYFNEAGEPLCYLCHIALKPVDHNELDDLLKKD